MQYQCHETQLNTLLFLFIALFCFCNLVLNLILFLEIYGKDKSIQPTPDLPIYSEF